MKKITSLALVAVAGAGLIAAPAASAGQLKIGGSTGAALLIQTAATQFNKANKAKGVTAGQYAGVGSGAGISGADRGTYDVGGSSRDSRSTDPKGLVFTPVAKESIAVIVHPKNPVCQKGLTLAQVQQLFTGTASQWNAVGGGSGAVNPLIRVSVSGTQASFERLYLNSAKAKGSPLFSNGAVRTKVKNDVNAVGAVTGAYIEGFKGVCGVKIDGVVPTLKNVANGKFKYWTYQYLVTKGAPAGDVKTFVDFTRSKNFQNKYVSKFAVPVGNAPPVTT